MRDVISRHIAAFNTVCYYNYDFSAPTLLVLPEISFGLPFDLLLCNPN